MRVKEHLKSGVFWYRVVMLLLVFDIASNAKVAAEMSDAARANAARALDRASAASSHAEEASNELQSVARAVRNLALNCQR